VRRDQEVGRCKVVIIGDHGHLSVSSPPEVRSAQCMRLTISAITFERIQGSVLLGMRVLWDPFLSWLDNAWRIARHPV
jgi:hypothetical protein